MKKVILQLVFLLTGVNVFAQSHYLHNNSTTVLITPDAITTGHISGTPTTNTNLSVGKDALPLAPLSISQNLFNTAIGHQTLLMNASGSYNVALGFNSLSSLNDGNRNIAVGVDALKSNNSGTANIGIGYQSLRNNINLSQNIAIGDSTLSTAIVGGGNNIAIGKNALKLKNNATNNIAIGVNALSEGWDLRSDNNIAIGFEAMKVHSHTNTASYINNLSIGHKTLSKSFQNAGSTIIGSESFANANYSLSNTIVGSYVMQNTTAGSNNNTLIGTGVMRYSTGSYNVIIGADAASTFPTTNNMLIIENSSSTSPLIGGDFAQNRIGINRLYTLISTDNNQLQVQGKIGLTGKLNFGLDGDSGFSYIQNSGSGAAGNLELSTNATVRMEIDAAGLVKLTNVPIYATNAAATTAGLLVGQIYRTATGQLMIVY